MLPLEYIHFTRQAALLFLVLSENAHTSQCTLLKADQVVLAGLLVIVALNVCHHEDSHALLDQLFFVEVPSLLQSLVFNALLLFLDKALVESIDPTRDESLAKGLIRIYSDFNSLFRQDSPILELLESAGEHLCLQNLLYVRGNSLQLLVIDCHRKDLLESGS